MWEDIIDAIEQTGLSFDEFLALYKLYSYEEKARIIQYNSDMFNTYLELEGKNMIKIYTNENEVLTFQLREEGRITIQRWLEKNNNKKDHNIQQLDTFITEKTETTNKKHKFDEFWMLFPSSDEHGVYKKTRVLKAAKDGCRKKYNSLIVEGYKHEDIIRALRYEIKFRKDSSNNGNKMTYMKNSLTWLNQKEFEVILETMSDDEEDNSTSNNDWTSNLI